jgi:hypothetical protein
MTHVVCELLWIQRVLTELGIHYTDPMTLHCDNKVVISIAHNPVQHDRTKHVEIDRHFIKEKLDQKLIQFPFIQSAYQLANILTKAVSGPTFQRVITKLGMTDIYAPT